MSMPAPNGGEVSRESDRYLLYKVACYYYQDGLLQEEISAMEQISRSQISRYLSRARELGIVKVSVALPEEPDILALEKRLEAKLGLEKVVVAPCSSGREDARIRAIASSAAVYLSQVLRNAHIIGFGWGRTIYETSLQMPYSKNVQNAALYVPLIGVSGVSDSSFQINTIIDRIAERRKGQGYFLALPTFRQKLIPMAGIDNARIKKLMDYWKVLDAAVFGLGTIRQSERFMGEEARPLYNQKVRNSKADGEILSQFFFQDGRLLAYDEEEYVQLAYGLHGLRDVPLTICLAGGDEKVIGITQGAQLGFFKHLVTDSHTAKQLDRGSGEGIEA